MSIHQKALADITWADLEQLIRDGVGEGPTLDYKRTLSHPDGDDPWIKAPDKGKIGRPARDELAIAVVAFANAYGGTVLLGVDEGAGNTGIPERLFPLPRATDLAERLHRAISDVVDPPMPGFLVAAILEPGGDGTGVIALRASASDAAPHGVGTPPAAYVRRGASATPMSMRDLQSVFWDARTRRERVEQIRAQHSAALALAFKHKENGELKSGGGELVPADQPGLLVRVSAIPQQSLEIAPLPFDDWRGQLRPTMRLLTGGLSPAFGEGSFGNRWSRTAHGAWSIEFGPSRWSIKDDATISVIGFRPGHVGKDKEKLLNWHAPSWHSLLVAQIIIMSDRVRRFSGRPDIPIEIDCEFIHDGTAMGGTESDFQWGMVDVQPMLSGVSIGPFLLTARTEVEDLYKRIEGEIWHAFGHSEVERSPVNFAQAFQSRP